MPRKDAKAKAPQSDEEHEHEGTPEDSTDEYPDESPVPSGSKKKKSGRNTRERPKQRKLVRWNEILDQRTLLAVQYECNIHGIKIPWAQVGARLGDTITEGAIVQHLAKLRNKMERDKIAVTPALKRGGGKPANNTKTVSVKGAVAKRSGNSKDKIPVKKQVEVEDGDKEGEYDDSEDEPIIKRKNRPQSKKDKTAVKGTSSPRVKSEKDLDIEEIQSDKQFLKSDRSFDAEGDTDNMDYPERLTELGSETGFTETQAVAVGAPFLAQELTDKSSVSSNDTSIPSKMVVLQVGHNNAHVIQEWQKDVENGGSRVNSQGNSHAIALNGYSNQPLSYARQGDNAFLGADMPSANNDTAVYGHYDTNMAYSDNNNFGFDQQDNFDLATLEAPLVKHESRGGSNSAGYGIPSGHYSSDVQIGDFDKTMMADMASQYGAVSFQHGNYAQGHNYGSSNLENDAGSFGLDSDFLGYGLPQPETLYPHNSFGAQRTSFTNQSGYVSSPKRQKINPDNAAGNYRNRGTNLSSFINSYGNQATVPCVPVAPDAAPQRRGGYNPKASTKTEQPDSSNAGAQASAPFNQSFSPAFDFENGDDPNNQLGNPPWYQDPTPAMGSNDVGNWGFMSPSDDFHPIFGFD